MLDHFGHGRNPDQQQRESKVNQNKMLASQGNIWNFLEALGEYRPGNVIRVVSLGSPEEVEDGWQSQNHNMELSSDASSSLFTDEQVRGEGEGLTPFLPAEGGLAREGGGLFDILADGVAAYTEEGGV